MPSYLVNVLPSSRHCFRLITGIVCVPVADISHHRRRSFRPAPDQMVLARRAGAAGGPRGLTCSPTGRARLWLDHVVFKALYDSMQKMHVTSFVG